MNPTQNRSKKETRDGSIDRFRPLCQDIESATAEYPSGLRGRIANPLFVGSNPTSAFFFNCITDENRSADSPSSQQDRKIRTTHDAIAVDVVFRSAPRGQQRGEIDAIHDAIIVQVSGNALGFEGDGDRERQGARLCSGEWLIIDGDLQRIVGRGPTQSSWIKPKHEV